MGEAGWGGGEAGLQKMSPLHLSSSELSKVPGKMVVIGVEGSYWGGGQVCGFKIR